MKLPMRRYKVPDMACDTCGQRLLFREGGWHHSPPLKIKDPRWHFPKPVLP